MLIRHGEPDDIVHEPMSWSGSAREAWIYWGLNGSRALFEFQKMRQWADWIATTPAACNPSESGSGDVPTLEYSTRIGVADPASAMNGFRCYNLVNSGRIADELPYIRLTEASRRMEARRDIAEALSTETATPRFENFVRALSSVYSFRGDDGRTLLAAFVMVPGGEVTPRAVFGGFVYPMRLTLAVEDPLAERVERLDTLIAYRSAALLTDDQQLRTGIQMPARNAEDATVRVTLVNPDHADEGQILITNRSVPAWPDSGLSMSDLVVGEPGEGTWTRGSIAISPLPGHQIPTDRPFRLFYEVYGLEPDHSYRTRITIAPGTEPDLLARLKSLFGDRRVLELSFDETARPGPGGVVQSDRTITPSLEPGRYTVRITVELPSTGDSVSMETRILLLER